MATQSRVFWDNGHPEALGTVTIFWDDVTLLLTAVNINNTNGLTPIHLVFTVLKNGRVIDQTVAAGATLQVNIPTGQAQRFEFFVNPDNGRLDGINSSIS